MVKIKNCCMNDIKFNMFHTTVFVLQKSVFNEIKYLHRKWCI